MVKLPTKGPGHIGNPKVRKPRKPNHQAMEHNEEQEMQEITDGTQTSVSERKRRKPRRTNRAKPERNEEHEENKRQPSNVLYKNIAESSGLEVKDVKAVFGALFKQITTQLCEDRKFIIPNVALFNLKDTPARDAVIKKIKDKEFQLPAKPPGKRIHPLILKPLKIAVNGFRE